jgi:23S rRNA (pseudouridine1915-N3)-methyltransferase
VRLPDFVALHARARPSHPALIDAELGRRLDALGLAGQSHVAFLIGGPLGLSPELLGQADEVLSFGRMTLPHALARVVLLEQLYRAAKIERGEKYHW